MTCHTNSRGYGNSRLAVVSMMMSIRCLPLATFTLPVCIGSPTADLRGIGSANPVWLSVEPKPEGGRRGDGIRDDLRVGGRNRAAEAVAHLAAAAGEGLMSCGDCHGLSIRYRRLDR